MTLTIFRKERLPAPDQSEPITNEIKQSTDLIAAMSLQILRIEQAAIAKIEQLTKQLENRQFLFLIICKETETLRTTCFAQNEKIKQLQKKIDEITLKTDPIEGRFRANSFP